MRLLYIALLLVFSPGLALSQSPSFHEASTPDIVLPLPFYERSYNEGVHYIIAGGDGASTYKPSNPQNNQCSQMVYSDLSYLIFSLWQEQATVEAYGVDGKLLEAFSIP